MWVAKFAVVMVAFNDRSPDQISANYNGRMTVKLNYGTSYFVVKWKHILNYAELSFNFWVRLNS